MSLSPRRLYERTCPVVPCDHDACCAEKPLGVFELPCSEGPRSRQSQFRLMIFRVSRMLEAPGFETPYAVDFLEKTVRSVSLRAENFHGGDKHDSVGGEGGRIDSRTYNL